MCFSVIWLIIDVILTAVWCLSFWHCFDCWSQCDALSYVEIVVYKCLPQFGSKQMTLKNLTKMCPLHARSTRSRSTNYWCRTFACINCSTFICILIAKYAFHVFGQIWMSTNALYLTFVQSFTWLMILSSPYKHMYKRSFSLSILCVHCLACKSQKWQFGEGCDETILTEGT